jgi:hypothetical protein
MNTFGIGESRRSTMSGAGEKPDGVSNRDSGSGGDSVKEIETDEDLIGFDVDDSAGRAGGDQRDSQKSEETK